MNALKNFLADDNGATLVEYALIVALVAVACIATISVLSGKIQAEFTTIASDL
jgi:pilus assembly protein Flp/PilA